VGKTGIREHPATLGESEVIVREKDDGVAVCLLSKKRLRTAYASPWVKEDLQEDSEVAA
jgi:hypothetical protein